jgi:C-terminal processing protease CtpA/Prc
VGLPAAAYLTWKGKLIEGKGVTPSVPVEPLPNDLLAGQAPQMQKAIEIVRGDVRGFYFANADAGRMSRAIGHVRFRD